jgi:hypothetical protein
MVERVLTSGGIPGDEVAGCIGVVVEGSCKVLEMI